MRWSLQFIWKMELENIYHNTEHKNDIIVFNRDLSRDDNHKRSMNFIQKEAVNYSKKSFVIDWFILFYICSQYVKC